MILIDTNILIDIAFAGSVWSGTSKDLLALCMSRGPAGYVDVVFAELSVGFPDAESVKQFLDELRVERSQMTEHALFLAGRAFAEYRRRGGVRSNVLADFFIGAQACALGAPILTRDEGRYRTYFPDVRLITPDV